MESIADAEGSVADIEAVQPDEIDDRRKNPDRRASARRKILRLGRTFWPNGDSSECRIHNLSQTGAQLELRGPAPNFFELLIDGDRWRRSCAVVWRKGNRAGVKFQDQSRVMASPKSLMKQVDECRRFAEVCRSLAGRAAPSDSELLLEMASAWTVVIRQLRRKRRHADA